MCPQPAGVFLVRAADVVQFRQLMMGGCHETVMLVPAVALVASLHAGAALAAEFGTAKEAKAMLDKAVAEMKKDKAAPLPGSTRGRGASGIAISTRSARR